MKDKRMNMEHQEDELKPLRFGAANDTSGGPTGAQSYYFYHKSFMYVIVMSVVV